MLSKRDKLFQAVERLHCLCCPACRKADGTASLLERAGDDLLCSRGHRININRKGCINVLSQQTDSCYDAALFAARRRVFAAGCYTPVAEAMDALIAEHGTAETEKRLLDAGCGDGWYLDALLTRHPSWCGTGVDISRDAILQATDLPCTALWCVGDLRRLPFADGSFDAVLDVLTPASYDEFARVTKPDGLLIKVYPGSGYLQELRAARGMTPYEEGQVDAYLRGRAGVVGERHVQRVWSVTPDLWRDFVWMTPLMQDLSDAEKEKIAAAPRETVTIDLHVCACRR